MPFRIISYNMHRAIGVDRRFRPERIARIIAHHDPDIVLLQEVDVGVPRSQNLNLAEEMATRLGYPYFALGLNVTLKKGHYGNATLSRFPIVAERNIDLTMPFRKARGCLYTSLMLEGGPGSAKKLAIFNLHLGLSFKERPRQIGLLVRTEEFSSLTKEDPCIVAGDFNDWWTRLAPMFTEIMGFDCATNHRLGYQNAFLTYPSFSPTGGLDKIFSRGRLRVLKGRRCRLPVARVASDHLPVIADLQFR